MRVADEIPKGKSEIDSNAFVEEMSTSIHEEIYAGLPEEYAGECWKGLPKKLKWNCRRHSQKNCCRNFKRVL